MMGHRQRATGVACRQRGLSLVEMMVAMAVSLLLLAGVVEIFLANRQSFRTQEALARSQEAGRFAIELIARDLRMAGYQGCMRTGTTNFNIIANPAPVTTFDADSALVVYEATGTNTWSPSLPSGISPESGTDVLEIVGGDGGDAVLLPEKASNANIQVEPPVPWEAGDYLMVSDCLNADIFRATSVSQGTSGKVTIAHANSMNTANKLSKIYGKDAMVMSFRRRRYFVADTGRTNSTGGTVPALYRQTVDGTTEELLEGVENLQVELGVDTDSDGAVDRHVKGNAVPAGATIKSVRITLTVRSIEDNVAVVGGGSDRHLRKNFVTTVQLRNLGLGT